VYGWEMHVAWPRLLNAQSRIEGVFRGIDADQINSILSFVAGCRRSCIPDWPRAGNAAGGEEAAAGMGAAEAEHARRMVTSGIDARGYDPHEVSILTLKL